jgi:hypothetical protein
MVEVTDRLDWSEGGRELRTWKLEEEGRPWEEVDTGKQCEYCDEKR